MTSASEEGWGGGKGKGRSEKMAEMAVGVADLILSSRCARPTVRQPNLATEQAHQVRMSLR